MEEDDDLFLVIVENENGENDKFPLPIIAKQEPLDEAEYKLAVENIIETAEKHGVFIDIEHDGDSDKNEQYFDEEDIDHIKRMEDFPESDEEYVLQTENTRKNSVKGLRRKMLKPDEQKSFVADLKDKYPELRKNSKLLVSTLCEIMRSVKPPPPPEGYYFEDDEVFECTKCGAITESIPAASRHYHEKHGPRYLMCYACGVDFRSTTNLYKHEKRCMAPDSRIVLKARATCLGSKGRSRPFLHLRRNALPGIQQAKFACTLCSATFNTKYNLMSHEYMHKGERPFQCSICPAAYTSNSALYRHLKTHSGVQYICDHCGRSFKVKAALVAHMNTHQPTRKHGCNECGRRFAQKSALQLHVNRVHRHLPPPCACEICPKRYPRMSLLKTHMKNEHGLAIMTRKMFFKTLPMMSPSEVKLTAKLVFNRDAELRNSKVKEEYPCVDENMEIILPDNLDSGEFIAY